MSHKDLLVFSFYTEDAYYAACAQKLREQLDLLGVEHRIEPIARPEGVEWPEICRKKIPFMHKVLSECSARRAVWMDVDCNLNRIPEFLTDYDADLMAFRRGFPSSADKAPRRARHWEPCFLVFAKSPAMLEYLAYAAELEKTSPDIRATDDYFFEEAWRKLGHTLKTHVIPGEMCSRYWKEPLTPFEQRKKFVFFEFGASGNVAEYKSKVVQHVPGGKPPSKLQRQLLGWLRKIKLPGKKKKTPGQVAAAAQSKLDRLISTAGASGGAALDSAESMKAMHVSENERELVKAMFSYSNGHDSAAIKLHWFIRPAPGNMGDWLSPYVVNRLAGKPVEYASAGQADLFAIGSIGRLVGENQLVWGTGISTADAVLHPKAEYLAVRGPHTRAAIIRNGGQCPDVLGDPGFLMRDLYTPRTQPERGRFGLVRHYVHQPNPLTVGEGVDDINILLSSARDIELFIDRLKRCEAVVTSSLHVTILCHAYRIPCRLITLAGQEAAVHGDGIKYRDYFEGAGLQPYSMEVVSGSLSGADIAALALNDFPSSDYGSGLKDALLSRVS